MHHCHPAAPAIARNPVLLIHGLTDTSQKMWQIADYLASLGCEVLTLDLRPNNGDANLEVLAAQVAATIERSFPSHQQIDLVGFSMGGLVGRYYLQRLGGIDRVQRFITISSPHQGTLAAYFSLRPGCVQMRPDSSFIDDLRRDVDVLDRLNVTSIWTPFDLMILPPDSSRLGFGEDVVLPIAAHPLMVSDPLALAAIHQALCQPVESPI